MQCKCFKDLFIYQPRNLYTLTQRGRLVLNFTGGENKKQNEVMYCGLHIKSLTKMEEIMKSIF